MEKYIKIAYIGGGSKQWARVFMSDLAVSEGLGCEIRLYDIDRVSAERNAAIGRRINENPAAKSRFDYSVADTLDEALTGLYSPVNHFFKVKEFTYTPVAL